MKKSMHSTSTHTMIQRNGLRRVFSSRLIHGNTVHQSEKSYSFTPTTELDLKLSAMARKNDEAIPLMPDPSLVLKLYKNIVKPEHVMDLLFRPSATDYLVTGLAKDATLLGDSTYTVQSSSSIRSSKFVFANLAIRWLDDFNASSPELTPLPSKSDTMSYETPVAEELYSAFYTDDTLSTQATVLQFMTSARKVSSMEDAARFLLLRADAQGYALVLDYLSENISFLNRSTLVEFVDFLLRDLLKLTTLEKVESCVSFLEDDLIAGYPDLLQSLDVTSLDKVAYVASFCSNLATAKRAFGILVKERGILPLKRTFDMFISRYLERAMDEKAAGSEIVAELSLLKPVFDRHELSRKTLNFLLRNVIKNTHDLDHYLKLALRNSVHNIDAEAVLVHMNKLLKASHEKRVFKAVQAAQVIRLLRQSGVQVNDEGVVVELCRVYEVRQ